MINFVKFVNVVLVVVGKVALTIILAVCRNFVIGVNGQAGGLVTDLVAETAHNGRFVYLFTQTGTLP